MLDLSEILDGRFAGAPWLIPPRRGRARWACCRGTWSVRPDIGHPEEQYSPIALPPSWPERLPTLPWPPRPVSLGLGSMLTSTAARGPGRDGAWPTVDIHLVPMSMASMPAVRRRARRRHSTPMGFNAWSSALA